jgi:hypothetical protein
MGAFAESSREGGMGHMKTECVTYPWFRMVFGG